MLGREGVKDRRRVSGDMGRVRDGFGRRLLEMIRERMVRDSKCMADGICGSEDGVSMWSDGRGRGGSFGDEGTRRIRSTRLDSISPRHSD